MNDELLVDRFLDTQSIELTTRCSYSQMLRNFNKFVIKRTHGTNGPTLETLRAWLRVETQKSPIAIVANQVRVVARYFEWRMTIGGSSHLLLELRAQHGRFVEPIVRALLEDDYESALLRIKPLPEWGSVLGQTMREHVARMQSLGYRYDARRLDLRSFDQFLQRHPDLAAASLPKKLEAWRHERRGLRHQFRVQQCGQVLSKALHRKDNSVPILPIEAGLYSRMAQQERRPYLFTEMEVRRLLDAARMFPSQKNAPLRPIALHAMITLAYCAGLRVGEIASLTLGDLDLENGLLEIRETKFFKSRRLPLAPSALGVMRAYLDARAESGAPIVPKAPMWWSPLRRHGYCLGAIQQFLTAVIRNAGLKPTGGRQGPRVHDLRHTFVAHRMMRWYRDGVEPQALLPYLATYLGHKDIRSTLAYLHVTPELLQQASERHRNHNVGVLLRSTGDML